MEYIYTSEELYVLNEDNQKIVSILTPIIKEGLVQIKKVFVDESLRGQGIASIAMKELCKNLRENNLKAVPLCSYAVMWFQKNKEYIDCLEEN